MNSQIDQLLATASVAAFAATLDVSDAAAGTMVQIVPAGVFSGRDGRGPYDAGGRAQMEQIVATTKKLAGTTELVIDYDHQSVHGAVPGVGGTAKAAGWIKRLEVRDDGIYGEVQWTETAASMIKAGEYRYLSPVFLHTKAGKVLVIRMAGLTNTPALDLLPVAASALLIRTSHTGDSMDKILQALGLAAGGGEDAVLSAINSLLANSTAIAKAVGLADTARPAEILQAVNSAFADRGRIASAAGLSGSARGDEIVTAIQSAMSAGSPDPAKFVPVGGLTALQDEVKTLRAELTGDKAEQAVSSAIKDGKLIPALKDWGLQLYKQDPAQFGTFVGSAPVLTAPQLTQTKREAGQPAPLDETQLAVCSALGIDPKTYAATLAAEEEAR